MCTAATYLTGDFYFGRTLDYDFSYREEVTVTPRNFPLRFRAADALTHHYAMIGMAYVPSDFPLYYDAVNEKGLAMAGLNFVGNAVYREPMTEKNNVAQFEFIPWLLGTCASVTEAREALKNLNLTNAAFSESLPPAQLHWMIADRRAAITVESTAEGLQVYDNPVGVLTNNPPFDMQLFHLNNYLNLSPREPENRFSAQIPLNSFSRGMGAIGLPGDLSSQSRFVRASFVRANSVSGDSEVESVSQFFHILGSVDQQRGCCALEEGKYEVTIYTACCNADRGIYYYTTYDNSGLTAVDMRREDLDGSHLKRYPLLREPRILFQN